MFGIIIALHSEAKALLSSVENLKKIELIDKEAYMAEICGHKAVIAISGIGKVNAGLTTQLVIDKFNPDFILNFGTCGGMNDSVEILQYYAITKCCQFDFDLRELDGVPLGYIQDYDRVFFPTQTKGIEYLKTSVVASADRFNNSGIDIKSINDMGASLRDMEAGAIGQVCLSNAVPLYMIKGISDVYGSGTAQEQFFRNLNAVSEGFPKVVLTAISNIIKALNL